MLESVSCDSVVHKQEDTDITTLYVGGITDEIDEADVRDQFYAYATLWANGLAATRLPRASNAHLRNSRGSASQTCGQRTVASQ